MLVSAGLYASPGAVVKIFLAAFPLAALEVVELAGCFRFLEEELAEAGAAPSSNLAENEEVPGIKSLAAAAPLAPLTAVRLFRDVADETGSSLSALTPLTKLPETPLLRLADLETGWAISRSTSMSRSSA
ncbi:hypothetical protein BDQ94DRAFT_152403 [Aspergillus welwitschiae]|uniref:Uncharacterized protein n=1 Tax=Aspergillus welwitschiae TaxID=1341132 RepID=A0A3F3PN38_9EURO|nr:hypothetical protein BDQ94DRAFT_152403 [Aspergillus welwitschiae]RDH28253.1 hypothetical protein BDQ94DRAFT_152403 [Aspergillus welwitschiae]